MSRFIADTGDEGEEEVEEVDEDAPAAPADEEAVVDGGVWLHVPPARRSASTSSGFSKPNWMLM